MTFMDARTPPGEAAAFSWVGSERSVQADPEGRVRVLVVGQMLAQELAALLPADGDRLRLEPVSSFLAAMGELTHRSAEAVVGPLEAMAGIEASTAAALRQMAPATCLLALTEQGIGFEARTLCDAGFDGVLPWGPRQKEASLGQLIRVLAGRSLPERFEEEDVRPETEDAPAASQAADAQRQTVLPPQAGANTGAVDGAAGDSPPALPMESAGLGDIDLVDAVLAGDGGVFEVAQRLITERTGWTGLGWLPPERGLPAGHEGVAVAHQAKTLGWLHAAAPATAADLEPWAQWLGHWIRLEQQMDQLRHLSMRDELTGAWNRRYFFRSLEKALAEAAEKRQQVTVLLFDIDDFKNYNDTFGHATGDEILREVARLMQGMVREGDVVARIGGDEFAVIFCDRPEPRRQGSRHPADVIQTARRFQEAVCEHRFPRLSSVQGTLTISGGLAGFPWDGRTAEELVERADQMALESKRQGKNVITLGEGRLPRAD